MLSLVNKHGLEALSVSASLPDSGIEQWPKEIRPFWVLDFAEKENISE